MSNFFRPNSGPTASRDDDKQRVKDASDIVQVIGEHLTLKPKGREWVCLCPFHDDHRPSMNVIPDKQIFHCFVCGAGGDVFSFVKRYHKMEFREALEFLAERAHVTLTPFRPRSGSGSASASGWGADSGTGSGATGGAETESQVTRRDLLAATEQAQRFFKAILDHPSHGQRARDMIGRRGISSEMVERFGIGAAPDMWDGLVQTVRVNRLNTAAFSEADLFRRRESDGGFYDAFRDRLMFPIHDQVGRVIAFGGRRLRDEASEPGKDPPAKYLNSGDSRLFKKSGVLYALHQAARSIQSSGVAVVMEGYTDAIACHQAGFTNVVATLGTALTREHAALLRRSCHTVVLLFDGDEAGQRAGDRAFEKLFEPVVRQVYLQESLDVKVACLSDHTDAKDPDELLKREGGAEIFSRVLRGATDLLTYRFSRLRERARGAGAAQLTRLIGDELARLADLGLHDTEPLRKRLILQHVARVAGVDESVIVASVPAGRARSRGGPEAPARTGAGAAPGGNAESDAGGRVAGAAVASVGRLTGVELLLACALIDGSLWLRLTHDDRDLIARVGYRSLLLTRVHQCVEHLAEDGIAPGVDAVLADLDDEDVRSAAVGLLRRVQSTLGSDADLLPTWNEALASVRAVAAREDAVARASSSGSSPSRGEHPAGPSGGAAVGELDRIEALRRLSPEQRERRGALPRG
ncbi:MAG: CHC2 zinc finger domain-containing protein [Planctomycetota bacterium]|nr:CHC2 zinc finger domain-containing protein [Planctomycetota bacterium]